MTTEEHGSKTRTITVRLRLRDRHAALLNKQARAVNFVWNYLNETQMKAAQSGRRWLSNYDLHKLTAGSSEAVGLHSHTIKEVCRVYVLSRQSNKRPWLRWRGRRSLGWVPFSAGYVRFNGANFSFRREHYEPMHLRHALRPTDTIRAGSFNRDSRGHWYINVLTEVECASHAPASRIGIDLGLKSLASLSTGEKIKMPRFYRKSELALGTAQRARKTRRARTIHAKIAARRRDFLHKASAKIAAEHGLIVIGDVSPKQIAQTRFAKSSLDAGWSDFKRMLTYKAITHGGSAFEVSERYTSQVCSECGSLPLSRPRGIADIGIREWSCDDCGAVLDRDVNAARNILRLGLETLAEGAAYARSSQSKTECTEGACL